MKLHEMTGEQFIGNVLRNHWEWTFLKFCEAIGRPEAMEHRDAWVEERWEAFRKLNAALSACSNEFLEKIAQPRELPQA